MIITTRLRDLYSQMQSLGYIPSSVGISKEDYDDYVKELKTATAILGLVWNDKTDKLSYKGIELKVYGKQHTDSKKERKD